MRVRSTANQITSSIRKLTRTLFRQVPDSCGKCGGKGPTDPDGKPSSNYNCKGECVVKDCKGVCGGSAKSDSCGVCGGTGMSCTTTTKRATTAAKCIVTFWAKEEGDCAVSESAFLFCGE